MARHLSVDVMKDEILIAVYPFIMNRSPYSEMGINHSVGVPRAIFLIGHNIMSDILFRRQASFDINDIPNVTTIVDTRRLTRDLFDTNTHSLSLKCMLRAIGLSHTC